MYNLLVAFGGWPDNNNEIPAQRLFEYTDENIKNMFLQNITMIKKFPCLFIPEIGTGEDAKVGKIINIEVNDYKAKIEYIYDSDLQNLDFNEILELKNKLNISDFEFSRTHHSLKDVDLFEVILKNNILKMPRPTAFNINYSEMNSENFVAVMMPFSHDFTIVYEYIRMACDEANIRCYRADDFWESSIIVQDIVNLIVRSKLVICDCTNLNPNVFYEIGVAHTLGKNVILLNRKGQRFPFDITHHRYIEYNTSSVQELENMKERIKRRILQLIR